MLKNLTWEQKNILKSVELGTDLAADIAHSCVTVYVWGEENRTLKVYRQSLPKTQFIKENVMPVGFEIRAGEEPLVQRAMQRNVSLSGKREAAIGVFGAVYVYPLQDTYGKCFAAIAFESANPQKLFVETAVEFLKNSGRQIATNEFYKRLEHGDGILIVNSEKVIVAASARAKHIMQVLGIINIEGLRVNSRQINWPLVGMVLKTGHAEGKEINKQNLYLSLRVIPVQNKAEAETAVVILQDLTEIKKKEEELLVKSAVIKEIHHRVKNNLQTIAGLLRMQARRSVTDETKEVLRECINRVNSIAIVHEYLSQQDSGEIDIAVVAKGIYDAIIQSMISPELKLVSNFSVDNAVFPSNKATSIALVLNELLQNCIEHAFVGRTEGWIDVSFKRIGEEYCLTIEDNGQGLPDDFKLSEQKSLGLKIISTMVESDLRGIFTIINKPEGGTIAKVTIPAGDMK